MTKTVLITGVGGLLGANFARWLVQHKPNIQVVGIDNLFGGYREHIPSQVNFYQIDLTDHAQVKAIFEKHQPDLIYHFAAYAAEGLSPFVRVFNYNQNLLVTANLINLAINYGVKRFIFTSSMAVYGEGSGNPPFVESQKPDPVDPYGIAKYACELDLRSAGNQHGLEWCIIRPHNVYGPYQNIWDVYRNVIGIWMLQLLKGEPITVYGTGDQERAFSYVDDILDPLWKAGTDPKAVNQIYNLGGVHSITLKQLAEKLVETVGRGEIKYLEPRHEVKHAYCDHQKAIDDLGFQHQVDIEVGLVKMWAWVKEQPERARKYWNQYEVDTGLYEYWTPKTGTGFAKLNN